MNSTNAAKLYTAVQKQQALSEKKRAEKNLDNLVQMAEKRGYNYTQQQIKQELSQLTQEELASLMNPGVGPRQHLFAR